MARMASTPVPVALFGYGLAGAAFHAPLIAAEPRLALAAIVTRDEQRRAAAAQRFPDAALLSSAEEVWERAGDLGLVVVATPNRTHVPLAHGALEAGLPVVVDKPLAASADEARLLAAEADRRGLLLTVFQNRRWDGDLLTARRLIESGELGRVLRWESRFERWRPEIKQGWREQGAAEEAGGVLYDLGSHLVDQALVLFGPVTEVYAERDARRPGAQVDDDAFAALRHASGVRSHLWMSQVTPHAGPRLRVLGDRAAYVKHGLDVQEDALRAGGSPGDTGWGEEPERSWGVVGGGEEWRPVPTEPGAYQRFYAGVADALLEGAPAPVPATEALAALEVLDAARRSASEGIVVRL
jgi:predicted dehydrogenase